MTVIERVWVYVGSNGVLSGVTPDQAQAQEIADQRPGLRALEYVPAERLQGAVEAEREWCREILDVDQRDQGDGRLLATLANMARVRLRELGGQ